MRFRFYLLSIGLNAQSYCAAGPSQSFDSEITGVVLLGDNYSISQLSGACGPTKVQNFTISDSADLSIGTSYALDVTMGTCQLCRRYFCVDRFQRRGDFDDAGEQLGVYTGTPTVTKQWTFTVPATAVLGQTIAQSNATRREVILVSHLVIRSHGVLLKIIALILPIRHRHVLTHPIYRYHGSK